MALLQPGDLFPNGTASISFTSGSGITITPFSQSGDAYVVFETDLINYPNTTQYLEGATFTEKTNSLGEVVDGSGYRAGIFTYPGSSFVFTPSVDIPEGRVLIKSTGNIGLDVASFIGLLNLFPGAAAAYSLRKLDADYTGSAVEIRRDADNASSSFAFTSTGELDTSSILNFVNVTETLPADYGNGAAAAYSLRKVRENYTGNLIEVRRSSDNASGSFGFDSNGDLDTASLLSFVNEEITDNINTTTDSNADGLANGLIKLTNNPTATIVTGNGHIGSAQRMEYNVGAGNLQSIGINTLSTMIGQEITISFMYRSNISFSLGNGNGSAGGDFNSIPANTGDAIRYEHKGVWSPAAGADGRLQPMWLDASGEFIEISDWSVTYHTADGHVKTWYDQSGNNNNATQSTPGSQPKIVNTGSLVTENGKPAIDFDSTDDYFNLSSTLVFTNDFYINSVAKYNPNGTLFSVLTQGVSSANRIRLYDDGEIIFRITSTDASFSTASINTQSLYEFTRNSANDINIYQNSISLSGSSNISGNFDIFRIGANQTDPPTSGQFFGDTLQEIIIYSSDQSSNRPSIEANINSYYSIYTPTTNGFVKTWYDQSGNNNHATQTTNGSQPKIVNTGSLVTENGKAAIDFDGVDDYFGFTSLALDNMLISSVQKIDTNASALYNGSSDYFRSRLTGYRTSINSATIDFLGATIQQQTLLSFQRVGSALELFEDGASLGSGSNSSTFNIDEIGGNDVSFLFQGNLQELIIYTSNQSANRTGIETNINNFYSIYSP